MVRAKFRVQTIEFHDWSGSKGFTIKLQPVLRQSDDPDGENTRFWKATPSGEIRIDTTNEAAAKQFTPGAEFYVDFTPAA